MTKVEILEKEVQRLSHEELAAFRNWFHEYDWQVWDQQIERDSAEGKLDRLVMVQLGVTACAASHSADSIKSTTSSIVYGRSAIPIS